MEKIKILYTINFITNGGPSRVLLNQIYNLDKKIYDISLLTIIDQNNFEIINELKDFGVNVVEIKIPKTLWGAISNKNKIINEVLRIKPDIIHTHGIVTSIILSSNKIKCKRVTTIHNSINEDYQFTYGKLKGNIIARIHMKSLQKFDYIICCSKFSYDSIKNKFKNIMYIRNGEDVLTYTPTQKKEIREKIRKQLGIDNEAVVYCYCGVLNKRKKITELVQLFNECLNKDEYFIIVGDGPEADNVKRQIHNKNIIMVGFKNNVFDYYNASDVYVSNSSSEGFSMSIIEALSCNLLLLLSDNPSHRECFDIDNSYYIGEIFIDDFAKKKNNVLKNIKKSNTNKFYKKYLSGKVMMDKYVKYYLAIINKGE